MNKYEERLEKCITSLNELEKLGLITFNEYCDIRDKATKGRSNFIEID